MAVWGWSGKSQSSTHASALAMTLIGVNISYLKFFFLLCLRSLKRLSSPCQPLPSSSLIWKTLSRTKGGYFSPCSTFKTCAAESKKNRRRQERNYAACATTETFRASTDKQLAWNDPTKHNFPSSIYSKLHITCHLHSVLSFCPVYHSYPEISYCQP